MTRAHFHYELSVSSVKDIRHKEAVEGCGKFEEVFLWVFVGAARGSMQRRELFAFGNPHPLQHLAKGGFDALDSLWPSLCRRRNPHLGLGPLVDLHATRLIISVAAVTAPGPLLWLGGECLFHRIAMQVAQLLHPACPQKTPPKPQTMRLEWGTYGSSSSPASYARMDSRGRLSLHGSC